MVSHAQSACLDFKKKSGAKRCSIWVSIAVTLTFCVACKNTTVANTPCSLGSYSVDKKQIEYFSIAPVKNNAEYVASLSFGTPEQSFPMILDTGSSNLAVLGDEKLCKNCPSGGYTPSAQAKNLNTFFQLSYGSASISLDTYQDSYHLACDPKSYQESFGVIKSIDGGEISHILGLAYPSLVHPPIDPAPTFLEVLREQNPDLSNLFTLMLCGERDGSTFIIGNTDARIDPSQITYTPIVQQSWYVINAPSLLVKDWVKTRTGAWQFKASTPTQPTQTLVGDLSDSRIPTIVDSGTTRSYFPHAVIRELRTLMPLVARKYGIPIPPTFWTAGDSGDSNSVFSFTDAQLAQFPTLQISMRGEGANAGTLSYLDFPPKLYLQEVGGGLRIFAPREADYITILGQSLMEGYYVVFDIEGKRIGFASSDALCG